MLGDKKHRPPHHRPKDKIVRQLNFDQEQAAAYDLLIKEHRKAIKRKEKTISTSKEALYRLLSSEQSDTTQREQLLNTIANNKKDIERIHFNHFLKIKAICKSDQLLAYKGLISELSRIFNLPPPPHQHKK